MSRQTRTITLTILATLFVVFALQNVHHVRVNVIFWQPAIPLVLLIALAFGLGFAVHAVGRRR